MKLTGYEYEAQQVRDQTNKDWLVATDRDVFLDDYVQYCKLTLNRAEDAQRLFSEARDIAYYERNGVDQSEAITDLLTRVQRFKCKHEEIHSVTRGTPPDNYFDETWCKSCGLLVHSDMIHGQSNFDLVVAAARGETL